MRRLASYLCNFKIPARSCSSSVRLGYTEYNLTSVTAEGNPSPMLILHGLFGSQKNWRSLAKAISHCGRQVLTADLRNHGESPHTPHMTYDAMADDILSLVEELDLDKVTLVGHSMGGKAAMVTALKHPEIVDKLVVVDVSPGASPSANTFADFVQELYSFDFNELGTARSLMEARDQLIDIEHFKDLVPELSVRQFLASSLQQSANGLQWKFNIKAIVDHAGDIVGFPDTGTLQYHGPCLFIGGELSSYLNQISEAALRKLFTQAKINLIVNAGHWVHVDQSRRFLQVLMDFITIE